MLSRTVAVAGLDGVGRATLHGVKGWVHKGGVAIRIPLGVSIEGKGYLEDRRPAANVDPYVVAGKLIETTLAK